jgi:hypothetical protein
MLDMLRQFDVSIASFNHIALFMKRFDLPTSSGSPPLPMAGYDGGLSAAPRFFDERAENPVYMLLGSIGNSDCI